MTTSTTTTATLDRLLDEELAFSPSFLVHYSNHLAMALVALHHMGAPPEALEATFAAHAAEESERRDDRPALEERRREVARDGIEATVRTRTTRLVEGPGSQLFHPVIRLGYALDVGHEGQVAAALLDWERRHEVLPVPVPTPGERRLPDVAADLSAHAAGTWSPTFDLPGTARRPELREALEGVALDAATLDDVSRFAIAAHAAADHFITLHLVTGARALRRVSEVLDDELATRLAGHALPVVATAYAAVGAPPLPGADELDELRRSPLPSREQVVARAVVDRDPHVIKLAEAALAEEARTGDPLYRFGAARVVGLLGT